MTGPLFSTRGAEGALRPHQERGLEALRGSLAAGKRRPLLQLPTGAGKTVVAANIIRRALAKGKCVAVVVPALSLIDQTVAAFEAEGIHCIGVIQGLHERTDRDQPVQVCSVQTIARRKRPDVDLVIVDEAHELHKEIFRWMADCPDIPFIGLSATPWARGLGKYYDDVIIAATTKDLIEQGYLSKFKVFAPSEPNLEGVRTLAGDFHERELADAVDKPALVGDVIQTWIDRGENRPTLCYAVNRPHAEHLQQRFVEAGVAAEYIDCYTDRVDRERIFDRFRAGATKVICNVATLATGIDLPWSPVSSTRGRQNRRCDSSRRSGADFGLSPAKTICSSSITPAIIFASASLTDIHHERLDPGERRKSATGGQGTSEAASASVPGLLGGLAALCAGLPRMREGPRESGQISSIATESWSSLGRL